MLYKTTEDYLYSQYKSFSIYIVIRLNAWEMSDRSKYHLKEIYEDTEVLFRSIIGAFFVFKVLLTLKNLFKLVNKLIDIMLTS